MIRDHVYFVAGAVAFKLFELALCAVPALADDPAAFLGCRGEASLAGTSQIDQNKINRTLKQAGVGADCNMAIAPSTVLGGGVRLDLGSGSTEAGLNAKLGYAINPGVLLYGLGQYNIDATKKPNGTGVLSAGVGAEVIVSKNTSAFFELQRDLARTGDARAISEQTTGRVGLRFKLQ
jgi:predicted porin